MIADTAIIHPNSKVADNVEIGHYSIIEENVEIGEGTSIGSHVVIDGPTKIGKGNKIHHHAAVGGPPQDLKFAGEKTWLEIGDNNVIREFSTLHRGSQHGGGVTRVGNNCMIMAYAHVAHDCQIGNEVILSNAVNMAGHVIIEDYVIVGGVTAIHQFVKIGKYAFIGGFSAVAQDVIPYALVAGERASIRGINRVGLQRRGFTSEERRNLQNVVRILLSKDMNRTHALEKIQEEYAGDEKVDFLMEFIKNSERGICL